MEFTKKDTNIIKGVAICFMLLHHLFAFPERVEAGTFISLISYGDTNLAVLIGAFGRICVPMFTFLSGYGIYRSSLSVREAPTALCTRHIFNLYKTYWMVFTVCLPVIVLKNLHLRTGLIYALIYNFLGLSCSFNPEWWFVLPFTVLLILFPAFKRFLERERAGLYTDLFLVVVLNTVFVYIIPAAMEWDILSMLGETVFYARLVELMELMPTFLVGCIFARYDILSALKTRIGGRPLWCAAALIGMIAVYFVRSVNSKYYDFVNAAAFVVCLTVFLPLKPVQVVGKVFEALGKESAVMWLIHTFFCYYWLQGLVYAPKYAVAVFIWLVILSFGGAKLIRFVWRFLVRGYRAVFARNVNA